MPAFMPATMPADPIVRAALCALAAWICFYASGWLVLGRARLVVPGMFARVAASAIVTTVCGVLLAAAEHFSLPALLAGNLVIALAGALVRRSLCSPDADDGASPLPDQSRHPDRLGWLVFVVALMAYWPPYPTFLGGSDSTAYVAAGI